MLARAGRRAAERHILRGRAGRDDEVQIVARDHRLVIVRRLGAGLLNDGASVRQIAVRHHHQLSAGMALQLAHGAKAGVPVIEAHDAHTIFVCHFDTPLCLFSR